MEKQNTIRQIFGQNLQFLRKQAKYSQEEFVKELGLTIKLQSIGTYERGESFPDVENLQDILFYFGYPYEVMTQINLAILPPERRESYRTLDNGLPRIAPSNTRLLTVTLDLNDREIVAFVPEKAAAGYTVGYSDPEFMQTLEGFRLPWLPENGSFRAFELKGDSMLPLSSGAIVVGRYIEEATDIKRGERYVVVSKDGIVYKRVYQPPVTTTSTNQHLLMVSDNSLYEPYEIAKDDILELWETYATIEMKGKR